jgi:hypothetical protein
MSRTTPAVQRARRKDLEDETRQMVRPDGGKMNRPLLQLLNFRCWKHDASTNPRSLLYYMDCHDDAEDCKGMGNLRNYIARPVELAIPKTIPRFLRLIRMYHGALSSC